MKKYILSAAFFLIFTQINAFTQDWFPLEIGNRWDYLLDCHTHGGYVFYDTLSVEIIGKLTLSNNIEYYLLKNEYPFWYDSTHYVRSEENKIYFYDEQDSIDCFALRFDLPSDSVYYDCKGFELNIIFIDTVYTFNYLDTIQVQYLKTFSKRFGLRDDWLIYGLTECRCELRGCIIAGNTYGQLLVSVEKDINPPSEFSLSQNYPNPFNPTTHFEFRIADFGFVSLKVYDVLGNEVATLVNEDKPAGEYEVEFSINSDEGQNLSSGVYFYQLRVTDPETSLGQVFVQTKKMVLLR